MHQRLLIIGLVWPEPSSSAAGIRMRQLMTLFVSEGYDVTFACAASKSPYSLPLHDLQVHEVSIALNDDSFNHFVQTLAPDIVLFDRFMIEEQFGWRVAQECPHAMRILDTEDLHFLRHARQKQGTHLNPNIYNEVTKREIAAILRSDITLIISKEELRLLTHTFRIDSRLLCYLPFLEPKITTAVTSLWNSFALRKDFVFIGNFLHEPNWQTVLRLKNEVWPLLRKKVPQSHLYIYGAYTPPKALQLNNPKEHFHIAGRAEDARQTISQYRLLLAPIPFGAGVKGKFIDAMQTGTPSITTHIGAEAMSSTNQPWPGAIEDDIPLFVERAAALYHDQEAWLAAQKNGITIINEEYEATKWQKPFLESLDYILHHLEQHREQNFIGQILQHHSLQSTKYMSLWIAEKNKLKE
ncbi:glycosyltransferase [Sphingobacterium sp. SYP-B4668]|uniref:glycosyltransferase n=1 Tax=Sphingobacterium sp. SYP-B4668 TaxID=2996035 RepID=UPI0022DE377A|nr:glycosyltransferase [Sphingobacterium sp. SYP-B4668]